MTKDLRRGIAVACALLGFPLAAHAQTTVNGRVTTDAQQPLAGAAISISALNVGAYTDAQGKYSFTVPARYNGQNVTITARRIGYLAKLVTTTLSGGTLTQDFTLAAAPTQLTGIVVTALGRTQERSQLGTSVQQLSTEDITQTKAQSVVQQLEGKVSGVAITSSGSPGGSSMITIRGSNSITGDNTPLFIVDGIAISKNDRGANPYGGWDFGSVLSDLNPDDIESLTVLKGPNAAALYGSRAANGVVLITTKRGRNSGGRIRTEFNSFYTFENPSRLPSYQNSYGQGAGGEFAYVDGQGGGVNDGADQSWGPRLDGRTSGCVFKAGTSTYDTAQPCTQFDDNLFGGPHPWIGHPNNVESFFNTGHTGSATISASGGTDRANARLSLGRDNLDSYIPGTFLTKTNALLAGQLQVSDRLNTNATLQYIRNNGSNRPGQGYGNSVLESFVWFGRQVNVDELKHNWENSATMNNGPENREFNWNYNFHNNPYFLMYGNPERDLRDRLMGSVGVSYKIYNWLNVTGNANSDLYRLHIDQNWSSANITGAPVDQNYAGAFAITDDYANQTNSSLLFNATPTIGKWTINATAGGNLRREAYNTTGVSTPGISSPGIYNVTNAAIAPTNNQTYINRNVNSIYGSAAFTWNGWWTVEGTGRNDWSSTLPQGKNSYFYPSVNTSLVLTDAFPSLKGLGSLSYLKLRGSLARVGSDAPPYSLQTVYNGFAHTFNSLPQFTLSDVIANPNLKPETTQSGEVGLEASWLDGRVDLDATYYGKTTRDQIFNVAISPTTGFASKALNAGSITNKGFEALLSVTPIQQRNGLEWTTSFNYSKNSSHVVSLAPGIQTIILPPSPVTGWWYVTVEADRKSTRLNSSHL